MSILGKFKFENFPESGLIAIIVALGVFLAIFGGSVQTPKFETGPDGKQYRAMVTDANGQQVPAFETSNKFFNPKTLVQIAKDTSFFAIMAVGVTFPLITAGTDLSIGSIYALASVSGALVLSPYGPTGGGVATVLGVLTTLGVGALLGLINGTMIAIFQVHPFIVTLGTMAIYRGIAFVQTQGQSITGFPLAFREFVRWQILPDLSLVPLIAMLLVTFLGWVLLAKTSFGRRIYAIGGNEIASRYSGVRVGMVKVVAYTITGLSAGVAALLSLGYYGAGSSGDGLGYELNAIAASVVGGTSMVGGRGTALGALLGAIILQMFSNGLVILNVSQTYNQIVIGVIVILAVVLDQLNTWMGQRRLVERTKKQQIVSETDVPAASTTKS
jgi:ribose/xylose/arabinose/galactoside ABC-type transport system permease subunit